MPIDVLHILNVREECNRLLNAIEAWQAAQGTYTSPTGSQWPLATPRQSGAVRHQSVLLTRALADLRRTR